MGLDKDFTVEAKSVSKTKALQLAAELERTIGRVLTGQQKPGQIDSGLLCSIVQAMRDHIKPDPPKPPRAPAPAPQRSFNPESAWPFPSSKAKKS